MPTPFTHLAYAQRFLADETLSRGAHAFLTAHLPAFMLGSIAADAQTIASMTREDTHFYSYDREISEHPYRLMLERYAASGLLLSAEACAFAAGYAAHLGMDEIWTLRMTRPHFAQREWASREKRFVALHLLLVSMDERDEQRLASATRDMLAVAAPDKWCPFIPDDVLRAWQTMIVRQMPPGGTSETLEVISPRVSIAPVQFRAMLDDSALMERDLWAHIPHALLTEVETDMFTGALGQLGDALERLGVLRQAG
jgi:hypothetical protein